MPDMQGAGVVAPQFADLADATMTDSLTQNRAERQRLQSDYLKSVDAETAARKKAADAQKPVLQEAQQALAAPMPEPPAPPDIAPPPSRKLTDFLAPVAGESPENTITKLIQGIGIMAAGIAGLRRGDATAALASLHGALKGWQEGDKERADRAFVDWSAASKRVSDDWERRHRVYRDALENHDLTVSQKIEAVKLKAIEEGHDVAAAQAARENIGELLQWNREDGMQLERFKEQRERLQMSIEAKREHDATIAELRKQTLALQQQKQSNVLDQYDDAAIEAIAWKTIHDGGRMPGVGYGPSGQIVRGKVMAKVAQIAKENNISLSALPGIGDEMKGAQNEINTASRQLAYWHANIGTFHKHVDQFLELSANTPRGQSPVANRAALKFQGKYAGDAQVAAYEAMANEIAMEYAKLSVGTAQGDSASRDEARKVINAAQNPEQIKSIMEQLVRAGENRRASWENAVKQGAEKVSTFGGRISAPLPPGTLGTPPPDLIWDEKTQKLRPR